MEIVLIVAVAENGVIGRDNAIPWRLKADQQRFKAITMGKPVVMGRKTFDRCAGRFPGGTNIVITRDPDSGPPARSSPNRSTAPAMARGDALRRSATEIAIIGGADIYAQWIAHADRLEITEVHAQIEGDTRLPAIDPSLWQETARVRHAAGPDDNADYSYVTYRRRQAALTALANVYIDKSASGIAASSRSARCKGLASPIKPG